MSNSQRSMDDDISQALALSLAMSHASRPENERSSERLSDAGLREALEASLRDAQEDDSATLRAIELAMAESLKHDDAGVPQHPDLDLGATPGQGSCMEQPIDLASAPAYGSGAPLPQVNAASAPPAPSSSADRHDTPPVFGSLCADDTPPAFHSFGADDTPPAFHSFGADDTPPAFRSLGAEDPPPEFRSLGGTHTQPAPTAAGLPLLSEPSRGWVCVCAPDEMAHLFAQEAFLMPAALRERSGTAQPGEPLFVLSTFDGLLRGGFEVARGPPRAHADGSASVPFTVVREALLEIAVPLSGSAMIALLGAHILGSQSCAELELWQADAIQGLLEEMAAQAHAEQGGHPGFLGTTEDGAAQAAAPRALGGADEPTMATMISDEEIMISDEEIARALQLEMEQERVREERAREERAREAALAEARREREAALMLAAKHEAEVRAAEARAQEEAAARLQAEEERLRLEDERRRRKQEEEDAARAMELQAQFDHQMESQREADAAAAHAMQAQFDSQADARMAQTLADEQQARALHIAMRAAANAGGPGGGSCGPRAGGGGPVVGGGGPGGGSGAGNVASASVPMGLPVSSPSKNEGRKLVVIDALNVGRSYNVGFTCPEHHHFKYNKQQSWKSVPCCATAIALAIDHFLHKGYRVEAFLPEWAYYGGKHGNMYAHDHRVLDKYVDPATGVCPNIMMCPAGADDDKFILQRAKNAIGEGYEVIVLSNDMYRDHIAAGTIDDAFMKRHAVKFQWLHGNQLFPMLP